MARYLIVLKSGEKIEADDARISGNFIEYITKGLHKTQVVSADNIQTVERKSAGMEGGMRFTGKHDSSFDPTPGSIGGSAFPEK